MSLYQRSCPREIEEALIAFQRKAVALGNKISRGPLWRTHLCASLAGSFAVTINNGERLNPNALLTDRECTLVWFSILAADAATRTIGEHPEGALLAMPIWLFEAPAVERGKDVVTEVEQTHRRLISGVAAGVASEIGAAFLDWALHSDTRGLQVLEQHIHEAAALVGGQRQRLVGRG